MPSPPFGGAASDQLAFKFSNAGQHCEHQPAVRRGRMCPPIAKGFEPARFSVISAKMFRRSGGRPRQPVQACDQQDIASLECVQSATELNTVPRGTTHLFFEDALGASRFQLAYLGIQSLTIR